ncbi:MAG: glycine cleavage system protein GcvH [Gammaproteobacteria bacterium]|nr:glycine cleavage system protein GcvH [Gammaproteobacteria bacterium]MDD9895643.1 glycine cleavage system protein GcvH [Gammaproteobacteria bacterium]MDD9958694.1 glycine cleavage system protein GcvH [Gammaproteobacteria bacterium]
MSNIPDDLKYVSTHEWIRVNDDGTATIGISDHAQDALGDIVFVELPEPGSSVNAKDEVAVVESVKAASDIYSPVSGEIIAVNDALVDAPEVVNSSPYENGWFFKMKVTDEAELQELLDADSYSDHCDDE